MTTIVMRTPCQVHKNCDETHCKVFHGKKYAEMTDEDKKNGHAFCEGELLNIRKNLLSKGYYKCSICGIVTHLNDATKCTPNIAVYYDALQITK